MKIYPTSGKEWFAVFLLPFKVFVPMGYLTIALGNGTPVYRLADPGHFTSLMLSTWVVSHYALLIGGMIQHEIGPRKAYLSTCGFIIASFILAWMTLPYLAHA